MGNYVIDMAKDIIGQYGKKFMDMDETTALNELGKIGIETTMKNIRDDLALMGVKFDVWFSEKSLKETGTYDRVLGMLRDNHYVAEKEEATWFVSTALGEDKDNVLIRSDGTPTYFAFDVAYHYNKFAERKFNRVIDIWGADHHGHVNRMKTVVGALGINPERLNIIITQLVTLKRGNEVVRISKRSGDLITLREVIDEVGVDACRFVFLSRSADSQMDFDLELAKKQSSDNPVYYVQYAHARISSILKLAQEQNINYDDGETSILDHESEIDLIKQMILLPEMVELIASTQEPHHLPFYAQQLATIFHSFYKQCRVVTDNKDMTRARLKLVRAAQIVLARTLYLMGMNAPESM
jgi:arginyl-tRNA synthetase